jgi:hypothetical protein
MTNALATEKQINFILSLRGERGLGLVEAEELRDGLTRAAASEEIGRLLKLPKVAVAAAADRVAVHDGHFAVTHEGVLRFYRVKKASKGRWAGYTFVNRYASDHFTRISRAEANAAKVEIAKDPKAAAELYARHIGTCYACNRQLTDALSRARGIGPDCFAQGRGF